MGFVLLDKMAINKGLFTFNPSPPAPSILCRITQKDETLVTTVRNLYYLLPYIHNSPKPHKLVSFLHSEALFQAGDLNLP